MKTRLRVSEATWLRTVEIYAPFAQAGVEGGCFWYGDRASGLVAVIGVPSQINRPRNFEISSDALAQLSLGVPESMSVLAQLHAHPGTRVRQSWWDDRVVVSRKIISIVLPSYGRIPVSLDACGVHQFVAGRWRCIARPDRAEIFGWVDGDAARVVDQR